MIPGNPVTVILSNCFLFGGTCEAVWGFTHACSEGDCDLAFLVGLLPPGFDLEASTEEGVPVCLNECDLLLLGLWSALKFSLLILPAFETTVKAHAS